MKGRHPQILGLKVKVILRYSYTLCCNVINQIVKSLQEDTYRFWGTKVKVTLTYSATLGCNVITQTALGLHIPYFILGWKEDTYMYRLWGQKSRSYWHVQSILSCNTISQICISLQTSYFSHRQRRNTSVYFGVKDSKVKAVVTSSLAGPLWLRQFSDSPCC